MAMLSVEAFAKLVYEGVRERLPDATLQAADGDRYRISNGARFLLIGALGGENVALFSLPQGGPIADSAVRAVSMIAWRDRCDELAVSGAVQAALSLLI